MLVWPPKNAILIIEYAKIRVDERGMNVVDAAIEAAKIRLRPILMTSFAFILGVLPLALSSGAGSGARTTMGITVVAWDDNSNIVWYLYHSNAVHHH